MEEVQGKVTLKSDTKGADEAKEALGGFGDSLNQIRNIALGLGLERLTEQFVDFGREVIDAGIKSAASLENIKIGFDSAFGESSGKMLTQLDAMSYKTPFASNQLDQLALSLKSMGDPTKEITGDLKDIANIAAGAGINFDQMSGIMQSASEALSIAFQRGQVSSLQLRSIARDNIPIYDALVKVLNESGNTIEKGGKQADAAAAKHSELSTKIKEQTDALKVLQEQHVKNTSEVAKHNLAIEKASDALKKLQGEYQKTGATMDSATSRGITKADLLSNTKNISISAKQLQEAFSLLANNKYLGDAQKQANTLNGVWKNLQQTFQDTARSILGVSDAGVVAKNGYFDHLQQGATALFTFLKDHKTEIVGFFNGLADAIVAVSNFAIGRLIPAFNQILPIIKPAFDFIVQEVKYFLIPLIAQLTDIWKQHHDTIVTVGKAISVVLYVALVGVVGIIGVLVNVVAALANGFLSFSEALNKFFQSISNYTQKLVSWVKSFHLPGLSIPGFANGVSNFAGGPAIVGENGPELVYLPAGSSVQPNINNSRNVNINMQNNVNSKADWSTVAREIGWRVNGR